MASDKNPGRNLGLFNYELWVTAYIKIRLPVLKYTNYKISCLESCGVHSPGSPRGTTCQQDCRKGKSARTEPKAISHVGWSLGKPGLLVSGPACKEFGSHHSILTSKKLNRLKINKSSQICHRIELTKQITFSKTGDRQTHRITIYWSRNPQEETFVGISTPIGKPKQNLQIAGSSVWTNLKSKNSRGVQFQGSPTLL